MLFIVVVFFFLPLNITDEVAVWLNKVGHKNKAQKKPQKNPQILSPYPTPKGKKISTPLKHRQTFRTPLSKASRVSLNVNTPSPLLSRPSTPFSLKRNPKQPHNLKNTTDFDITDSDPKLLYEHEDCSTTHHQDKLLSTVFEKLKENDTANDFQAFLDLVSQDRFPLDNIAFLLFLDTVRFFGCENPTTMRYRSITKPFWNTDRNLFHNKFLYFMGGPRSIGQEEIPYDSQFSRINFAVPDTKSLNEYKRSSFDIPKRMETGCLPNVLYNINVQPEDPFMLCANAKKVTSGVDNSGGDDDKFGFETGETHANRKERLQKETVE